MKKWNIISIVMLCATVLAAIACYVFVIKHFGASNIWLNFKPMFSICFITFMLGAGVWASALVLEKEANR